MIIGENLNQEQVDTLFADCMGEENDDGEIDYIRKCFPNRIGANNLLRWEASI